MRRWKYSRVLAMVGGALFATVVLVGVLVVLNAGWVFAECTGTGALGWTLPLVTGGIVGVVAWALLFKAPNYTGDDHAPRSMPCPACGKAVMPDWRMCPYCGSSVAGDSRVG